MITLISMLKKGDIGKIGEDIACEYLTEKGYQILDRNYRKPWGEIDIIAKAPERTLVFVEVKSLKTGALEGLKPEDHLTKSKLQKLRRSAGAFCAYNPEMVNEKKGWRIDLVAIEFMTDSQNAVRHYEGI